MNLLEQTISRSALTTPDGRRYPFTGSGARAPKIRWTGAEMDQDYIVSLAIAASDVAHAEGKARHAANITLGRTLYDDVTGFAFTRYNLEIYYDLPGITTLRRKRIARLLDSLPAWPFEPTPTGWCRSGYPQDMY